MNAFELRMLEGFGGAVMLRIGGRRFGTHVTSVAVSMNSGRYSDDGDEDTGRRQMDGVVHFMTAYPGISPSGSHLHTVQVYGV